MTDALIIVAEGSEEIEAVTPGDVLVRAGVGVVVAGVGGTLLRGSRGLPLAADVEIESLSGRLFDAVVLPGGARGAEHLAASEVVGRIVLDHWRAGRLVGAICAAPAVVLSPLGVLDGRRATGYPGLESRLNASTVYTDAQAVVEDGNLITSRGPATAMAFALALAARLAGTEAASRIASAMLVGAPG